MNPRVSVCCIYVREAVELAGPGCEQGSRSCSLLGRGSGPGCERGSQSWEGASSRAVIRAALLCRVDSMSCSRLP